MSEQSSLLNQPQSQSRISTRFKAWRQVKRSGLHWFIVLYGASLGAMLLLASLLKWGIGLL